MMERLEHGVPVERLESTRAEVGWPELPDDSGSGRYTLELPDDSGARLPFSERETRNTVRALTPEERSEILNQGRYSEEIVDTLASVSEYEIYEKAGLVESTLDGRPCLIRPEIDWGQRDPFQRDNRERAAMGLAPLDANGRPLELHHIGQHADSPLAELTFREHHCDGNDTILHDKSKATEVHGADNTWDRERTDYWKARAEREMNGL